MSHQQELLILSAILRGKKPNYTIEQYDELRKGLEEAMRKESKGSGGMGTAAELLNELGVHDRCVRVEYRKELTINNDNDDDVDKVNKQNCTPFARAAEFVEDLVEAVDNYQKNNEPS